MSDKTRLTLRRACPAHEIPQGTLTTIAAGTVVNLVQSLGDWHTVVTERGQMLRVAAGDSDALGMKPPPRPGAGESPCAPGSLEERCLAALESCYDPEYPANIVELGLVYACQLTPLPRGGHEAFVAMTLTAPGCGMGELLKQDVQNKLAEVEGIERVRVKIVFIPPWDPSRMTEAARLRLGLM